MSAAKKQFNTFIIGHIAVVFLVIFLFKTTFLKSWQIIPLHLIVITTLLMAGFIVARFFKKRFRLVSALIFGILGSLVFLIYLVNFLSNHFWNANVSFAFIVRYLKELDAILSGVPFALEMLSLLVILIFSAFCFVYYQYVTYLNKYDDRLRVSDFTVPAFISVVTLCLLFLSLVTDSMRAWSDEPVVSLALKYNHLEYMVSEDDISFPPIAVNAKMRQQKNIILIHADALRSDHMSSYGYKRDTTPYIKSLLSDGAVQIKLGLSICSESVCGLLSALGSRFVTEVDETTPLINTYLKQQDYRTVFIGTGDFTWENLGKVLSHDIDYFFRADLSTYFSINDDEIIPSTLMKIPEYSGVPTFFFLRFLSSHSIGKHYPQYKQFFPDEKNLLTFLFPSLGDENTQINAYDNRIVQLDAFIERSLSELDKKGYLENSLVVIYGDHGEALNEHGYYGHYINLYQEEIHVPIIFWMPGEKLSIANNMATLNDILPTVLELNDIPVTHKVDGISLLTKQDYRITYHTSRDRYLAVVEYSEQAVYKLLLDTETQQKYLFNLLSDPDEKNNLGALESLKQQQLLDLLNQYYSL